MSDLPLTQFDTTDKSVISLTTGAPGPKTLRECVLLFNKATTHRLNHTGDGALFQYGPEAGFSAFLIELQKFLEEHYGDKVDRKNLVLTSGASSGLFLIASLMLPKNRGVVFLENPTYFIAIKLLIEDLGHKVVPIPMSKDGSGIDIEALETAVQYESKISDVSESDNGTSFWAMYYTIPTYHNPTGCCMSIEKCRKVVEMSRNYNFLVVCDDVYNLLHFGTEKYPPKRLFAYDDPNDPKYKGTIISNGSFSKILTPGIRIGWIECSQKLKTVITDSAVLASGGSMNNYASGVVASALQLGLETEHLKKLKKLYSERMNIIHSLLIQHLPEGFHCTLPGGGYFLWIVGTPDFNSTKFNEHLLKTKKIGFLDGYNCSSMKLKGEGVTEEECCRNCMRISIAHHEIEVLIESITILCQELKAFIN